MQLCTKLFFAWILTYKVIIARGVVITYQSNTQVETARQDAAGQETDASTL